MLRTTLRFASRRNVPWGARAFCAPPHLLLRVSGGGLAKKPGYTGFGDLETMSPDPHECGEDSFFASERASALGVADGVGGWAENNIDPSLISRGLMVYAKENAEFLAAHEPQQSANDVLHQAYQCVCMDKDIVAGSSTALVIKLADQTLHDNHTEFKDKEVELAPMADPEESEDVEVVVEDEYEKEATEETEENANDNLSDPIDQRPALPAAESGYYLHSANLGDSGFIVIRDGKVWFESQPQVEHGVPLQLAQIPHELQGMGYFDNKPDEADLKAMAVQEDDIIVAGTDGVWDNIGATDVAMLHRHMFKGKAKMQDDELEYFTQACIQVATMGNRKPDDVTVVVAQVDRRRVADEELELKLAEALAKRQAEAEAAENEASGSEADSKNPSFQELYLEDIKRAGLEVDEMEAELFGIEMPAKETTEAEQQQQQPNDGIPTEDSK